MPDGAFRIDRLPMYQCTLMYTWYGVASRGSWRRQWLFHRAGGQARDVVVEEEDVEDDDRDGAEDGAGHELTPVVDVAADQLARDPDARRDLVRRRGER